MATKKATKRKPGERTRATPRTQPKHKVDVFVEEFVKHGNRTRAAAVAGYKQPRMAGSRLMTNDDIQERVDKRRAEAMARAGIQTDVVIGSLAEIATSSLADVLPDDEFLQKARALGTDHLIKKLRRTVRTTSGGEKIETYEYELFDRLNALSQLADNLGIKQQPRQNDADRDRREDYEALVERVIARAAAVGEVVTRTEVIARVIEQKPEAEQWLM